MIDKYEILIHALTSARRLAVAFSGGVDSSFLLYAAKEALGENAIALTAVSPMFPDREKKEAEVFCQKFGIRQIFFDYDVMSAEGIAENPPDRCYRCKKNLFAKMYSLAEQERATLIEGSNKDDEGDYRPGLKALEEMKIQSPLRIFGFTKAEIRSLSKTLGLPTWDKPSYACLATRIPYGEELDTTKLKMVERAEQYLMDQGFREVRVRVHGTVNARIELNPNDFRAFMRADVRLEVNQVFKQMGFAYVSLDLQGYRAGSMNESLDIR
ncbi:MAG: ATP-dependent sacrificial sulfur transferase LarE [Eubacterium sp.]|nr:ATP-dependent sacrificial sulfur transferase LarE [Eubacterium sp.]